MHRHRSTQPRVSNEPQNSNFEAGTALENLRAEVVDIEALARAAEAAADAAHADDRSPARGVRPDPVARHEDLGAGERVAPLRERAGHRAHRADGGAPEGVGALSDDSASGARPPARGGARPAAASARAGVKSAELRSNRPTARVRVQPRAEHVQSGAVRVQRVKRGPRRPRGTAGRRCRSSPVSRQTETASVDRQRLPS